MKINPIQNNTQNFNGYGARPLKGIVIRNTSTYNLYEVAAQLKKIGKKQNFDVYIQGTTIEKELPETATEFSKRTFSATSPWIQDEIIITKDKAIFGNSLEEKENQALTKYLGKQAEICSHNNYELEGGNTYLLEDNTLLLGESEDPKLAEKIFGTNKIIQIPEADFHIDLYIRPLRDKTILVADDDMTMQILENALATLRKTDCPNKNILLSKLSHCIYCMKYARSHTPYAEMSKVTKKLEENGFNIVKVPGRIYDCCGYNKDERKYLLNYMNAIVHVNNKNELVYLTNKANLLMGLGIPRKIAKHINLNMEEHFINAVKDYIKPENVYFIKGGRDRFANLGSILEKSSGGLHCLTTEVPR